ncbi:fatty-acid amide hydrolase 2-B isoform X1 [Plutella xylostella]|uniref:fatty-acid amide hydrolase 2-B isoform X1 n=1 Tax=Plutella xylostella TaxID=51655 RepID=UPI00203309D5|nr:fatty-acid amide hydrolase 2-B isoform X1 [Plutella xylostella]XP_048479126.1 fatty-acid amide hydrolase 2-B isoform X1 [Plutella xylostella]XP_048479128.1 fatty-acid amide hydrolase 2-B isoform X1 [Plutella xylostella]
MEVGVRIIGVVLRLLNLLTSIITAPYFWLYGRQLARPCPGDDNPILMYSAVELARKIRNGELRSKDVVSTYIARVNTVNKYLNAVVEERYSAALKEADAADRLLDEARASGDWARVEGKPLLGVPFTVKESCSLAGMSNAVGCLEFAGRRASTDGGAVRNVRLSGAIPLLVSNTPELCLGWETTNLLHGTTNNPYSLDRTPGGSSGGEAALIASGASPFGVASDIAGSIRIPAAFCGVFGHKPTPGIIPIDGHIPSLTDPNYPRFLTVGPIARRADDLIALTKIMAGENAHKLQLDKPVDFSKLKVFYMTESAKSIALTDTDPSIKDFIIDAANYLEKECGATISDKKFTAMEDSVEISISLFFAMKDIPNLLADPANPKKDRSGLLELLKLLLGGGSRSLQALGFALIKSTQLYIPTSRRPHYHELATLLREEIIQTLGSDGVFLYPVFSAPAHRHGGVFARAAGVMYTMLLNVLGLPAVAVPRRSGVLPTAIQVVAAPNQDRLCLAVAKKLEEAFGGWQPVPNDP